MAKKYKIICNTLNENSIGLQFASDGGTPLFTTGNFTIDTTLVPKENKTFNVGVSSPYYTLDDIGETTPTENELKVDKTKLTLNQDYSNPKTYSYFGSIKEYFRVNVEQIIKNWPASIYVNKVFNNITGNTVENYYYNPITKKSTFNLYNNFFVNIYDIKYTNQYQTNDGIENPLRNLITEYGSYVIFYNGKSYPILGFTGSTNFINEVVYFELDGDPFELVSGGTLSTNYHIKPNDVKVETFFSSLSDLGKQLLNRYIFPKYTIKFNYLSESSQGSFDFYVNSIYTWPVNDGYNLDITSDQFETYLTSIYGFCEYFDTNDTNIMNRQLVAESINRLNSIRRGDGSEDENDAEKMSKLINIYGREFDEVKKYIDGLSYLRNVTYDKKSNTPDSLIKNLSKTLGWSLITPMSDVDLINSFIPTKSVYSGYTINYSKYDAETEFWRRLIVNTSHLWKSKGTRKGIEFLLNFIGTPEQLVNFNEHIYIAKKPLNIELFKIVLNKLLGNSDLEPFNIDEEGFPKTLPNTSYSYYQSNGLWYRETAGSNSNLDLIEGNNPHVGPYDGGENYIDQFRCLLNIVSGYTQVSGNSITITNDTIQFNNLFKNYSEGLFNNYNGDVFLNSYNLDGTPNLCFTVTGTVITDPDPEYVLGLCGCILDISDKALMITVDKNDSLIPCGSKTSKCNYELLDRNSQPPYLIFVDNNVGDKTNLVTKECCVVNKQSGLDSGYVSTSPTWLELKGGLGYCYWDNVCLNGNIKVIGTDSNGNIIFLNLKTGVTGTTVQQLGLVSMTKETPLLECCKYFGGYYQYDTGTCNLNGAYTPPKGQAATVDLKGARQATNTTVDNNSPVAGLSNSRQKTTSFERQSKSETSCQVGKGSTVQLNSDGTISYVIPEKNYSYPPTAECCKVLSTPSIPTTFCDGKCYWINPNTDCSQYDDIKVTIGVNGNDGVYILSATNETCFYQVEFDMLINFDCNNFINCVGTGSTLQSLSAFTIDATIESVTGTTPVTIQTKPVFKFDINNKPTGIYFSGQESICQSLHNQILTELGSNCTIVTDETFSSKWVNVKFSINNSVIGNKIKLGFNFNNIPCDFNFLLDDIKIEKICTVTNKDIINLNSCIGFDLDRVVDNKKSWIRTEEKTKRVLDYLDYRDTSYYVDNDKLIINTKEIDLTLDPSRVIDNDVLCYIRKNDCFFKRDLDCSVDNIIFNGGFYQSLSGWTTSPELNSWVWFPGNSAAYDEGNVGGYITQNVLTTGKSYNVKFELINQDGDQVYVLAGTNVYGPFTSTTMVDINVLCTGNTNFSIYSINDCPQNKIFQNGDTFIFMSGDTYIFQNQ